MDSHKWGDIEPTPRDLLYWTRGLETCFTGPMGGEGLGNPLAYADAIDPSGTFFVSGLNVFFCDTPGFGVKYIM